MNSSQRLPVFLTEPHPCSYLEDRLAQTAFVDPSVPISQHLASSLNQQGFRRSGRYLYKPSCGPCNSCQPLRVRVAEFQPNKSQKRNWKQNSDLTVSIKTEPDLKPEFAAEQSQSYFDLYARYINDRHTEGDMFPPNQDQFESFIGQLYEFSRVIEFSLNDQLVMIALCDQLDDGYSAIYTFFDPKYGRRGLGVYSILWQIQHCAELNLPYLYMGFWIKQCNKMSYKSNYKPNELFCDGSWRADEN